MNDNELTYEELLAERDQYRQFADNYKKERDTANKNLKELARKVEEINPLKQKLAELQEENYLRDRGMSNPKALDYAAFRIRQKRDREGITFEEAADAYLEEHKHDPIIELSPPSPQSSFNRYSDQWKEADVAIDLLRKKKNDDAINYIRQKTEEKKQELANRLFGNKEEEK